MAADERRALADGVTVPAMGVAVVDPLVTLGNDRNGQGPDGQRAVFVGDLVVMRGILTVLVQDVYGEGVLCRAVPHVGDGDGLRGDLNAVTLDQRGAFPNEGLVMGVSRTVVGPGVVDGQYGDGALVDRQRARLEGHAVIAQLDRGVALGDGHAGLVNGDFPGADLGLRADRGGGEGLSAHQIVHRHRLTQQGRAVVGLIDGVGGDHDGTGGYAERTGLGHLQHVVVGLIDLGLVTDLQRKDVGHVALADVGNTGCPDHQGGVTRNQGGIGGDGEPAVGLGFAVVHEGMTLGGIANGLGLHSQRTVHVADLVVARDVPTVGALDGDGKEILRAALNHVGDLGLADRLRNLPADDLLVGGDGKGIVAVGVAVVDPVAVRGGDRDGSLIHRDEGLGYEDRVVPRHILSVSVVDIEEKNVLHGTAVGDQSAFGHGGGMAVDQGCVLRDFKLPERVGLSRVLEIRVVYVDLYGILMHRQLARNQGNGVVGGDVQGAKADDLDLGDVGDAACVGDGIPEGSDQAVFRAVGMYRQRTCAQLVAVKGEGQAVVGVLGVGYRYRDLSRDELNGRPYGIEDVGGGDVIPRGVPNDDLFGHGGDGGLGLRRVVEHISVTGNGVAADQLCRYGGRIAVGKQSRVYPHVHGPRENGEFVDLAVPIRSEGGGGHGADVVITGIAGHILRDGCKGAVLGVFVPRHLLEDGSRPVGQDVTVQDGGRAGDVFVHVPLRAEITGGQSQANAHDGQDQHAKALDCL